MFYSILLNLKSLFLYRKRYLVSQILTFTALSFVVLTAAKVIAAHSEVADFANTNIYTFAIREDAQPADLAAALNGFGELANENDVVQVFANPPGEDSWLLVGTNAFVDEFWYQQNVEEDFILTDEFYAWMDPDFWGDSASLDFPYASVRIRENSYTVAGVVDMPLYNMAGLAIRNGVFIPLRNYLACGYPIQSVTLRLYRPPSAQTHAAIASLFNPYAQEAIAPLAPPSPLAGWGSMLAAVCVPFIALCLCLVAIQAKSLCVARRQLIWTELCAGATHARVWREFFLQFLLLLLVGNLLAAVPSDMAYTMLDYERAIDARISLAVLLAYTGFAAALLAVGIHAGVHKCAREER